jgi:hypothetical protein
MYVLYTNVIDCDTYIHSYSVFPQISTSVLNALQHAHHRLKTEPEIAKRALSVYDSIETGDIPLAVSALYSMHWFQRSAFGVLTATLLTQTPAEREQRRPERTCPPHKPILPPARGISIPSKSRDTPVGTPVPVFPDTDSRTIPQKQQ